VAARCAGIAILSRVGSEAWGYALRRDTPPSLLFA